MAEVLTALSMANAGFKLAMTLYSFAEAVGSVDKELVRTATDIALFSDVLENLAATLEQGQKAKYITKKAFETVQKVIDECNKIFQELETMIEKSTKSEEVIRMKEDEMVPKLGSKLSVPLIKKLLYFFQRSKLEALRAELMSLKTNLNVMLGTLAIAQRFEEIRKSDPNVRPDSETAKARRAQDNLKMKCLVLANEAAAAEVRKLSKTKVKSAKDKIKTTETVLDARPSIASEGVFNELSKQSTSENSEAPAWIPMDKPPSNEISWGGVWSPAYSSAAAKKDPEESKISVQDTSKVVLALLALWVSNGAQLAEYNDQEHAAAVAEDKWKHEKKGKADEEEEVVDLFPKRESRPY